MRRIGLAIGLTFAVSLAITAGAAQAVVVDMGSGGYAGVSMMLQPSGPGIPPSPSPSQVGIPIVHGSAPCIDPAITPDFTLMNTALCWHGGNVMHSNEQFALVWDPNPHSNWTASYVEQFMRDVADGSGTLTSPYALTTQYTDTSGGCTPGSNICRAGNSSIYGGGYDDASQYPVQYGDPNYPDPNSPSCRPSGPQYLKIVGGKLSTGTNDVCLTDAQIRTELQNEIVQDGLTGKLQPSHTPMLVLLLPPGVVVCLDQPGHLCSANSDPSNVPGSTMRPAQFCSYHSQITTSDGRVWPYVVQPFTAETNDPPFGCDEPDTPKYTPPITPEALRIDAGSRLVSALARSEWGAITNPYLNGWYGFSGAEMGDNGCLPLDKHVDDAIVGTSGQNPYELQHGFSNAGAIVNDPFSPDCAPSVALNPLFVVPSAANQGDVIQFDGAKTQSTLLVPAVNFSWDFGDGTGTTVGPSQYHSYTKGGTYGVTLKVTDRGGNIATLSQTIQVLGPTGQPVTTPGSGSGGGGAVKTPLSVRLQLMPQSLKALLHGGLTLRVFSNMAANGIVTLSIPRSAAKRAHLKVGRSASVVIGRGTVSRIKAGSINLQLKLSPTVAGKLRRLGHLTVTVRLALVAATGDHKAFVAAARY